MTKVDEINKAIKDQIDVGYASSAYNIVSDYNGEISVKDDYRGRQIFELLQNADDCGEKNGEKISVKFQIVENADGGILVVKNTGEPFDVEGVKSLITADASGKHGNTIGCKGLGFRSVLNWTHEIKILTNDFKVSFSEDLARQKLDCFKKLPIADKQMLDTGNINRTAILASCLPKIPSPGEADEWLEGVYSTAIFLYCDEESLKDVMTQLDGLKFEELLFLRHIEKIEVETPAVVRTIERVAEEDPEAGCLRILIQDSKEVDDASDWYVWTKSGEYDGNGNERGGSFGITLAYNADGNEREKIRSETGYLYSYFSTNIRMPFPFLVHADFALESNRKSLLERDDRNKYILGQIAGFMAETAKIIRDVPVLWKSSFGERDWYAALKCLIPTDRQLDKILVAYGFWDCLKSKIMSDVGLEIFPSIGGEFLSYSEDLRYYDHTITENGRKVSLSDILNPVTFCNLLRHCDDEVVTRFLSDNGIGEYDPAKFVDMVNEGADEYVANGVNADIIKLMFEADSVLPSEVPYLLVDSSGERIRKEDGISKIFLTPRAPISLPQWFSVRFLDGKLEENLNAYFNTTNRDLAKQLNPFGVREYDFDSLIVELTGQCTESTERASELMRILYGYWVANKDGTKKTLQNLRNLMVVTRENTLVRACDCYLGREYGFEREERITSCMDGVSYLASAEALGLRDENEKGHTADELNEFLRLIGLAVFPRTANIAHEMAKEKDVCTRYLEYNSKSFPILTLYPGSKTVHSYYELAELNGLTVYVTDVNGLDGILGKADFRDIIYWLLKDENIMGCLQKDVERTSDSKIVGSSKKQKEKHIEFWQMRSWLKYRITTYPWIEVKCSEKKCTLSECTVADHSLSPIVEVLSDNYGDLAKVFGGQTRSKIVELFESLGMAYRYVDLPKEDIYRILLELPETFEMKSLPVVTGVYSAINTAYSDVGERTEPGSHSVKELVTDNVNRDKFFREGRILAKRGDSYEYLPVDEVYYVNKKIYSGKIIENYPIIPLGRRANRDKIRSIFGVQEIKNIGDKIEIDCDVREDLNKKFESEYRKQIVYVYASRLKSTKVSEDASKLRNSSVILASRVTLNYTEGDVAKKTGLGDYEVAVKDNVAYIVIPEGISELDELRTERDYKTAMSEVITTFLDIDSDPTTFSFIFSQSPEDNRICFTRFGDSGFLDTAVKQLGDSSTAKERFWRCVAYAAGRDGNPETILRDYGSLVPGNFDFLNVNASDNVDPIKNLFEAVGIEIEEYNRYSSFGDEIRFDRLNNDEFVRVKDANRKRYLYHKAKELVADPDASISEYNAVSDRYDRAECTDNVLCFDAEAKFEEVFDVSLANLPDVGDDYENLIKELVARNQKKKVQDDVSFQPSSVGADAERGEEAVGMSGNASPEVYVMDFSNCEVSPVHVTHRGKHTGKSSGGGVYNKNLSQKNDLEGAEAEKIVYEQLCEDEKKGRISNLAHYSGNARGDGESGNDSLGYDIAYTDDSGIKHYVEVKSNSAGKPEFILTENEYDTAKKIRETSNAKFDVWLVVSKGNGIRDILILNDLLDFTTDDGQSFASNKRYHAVTIDYRIIINENFELKKRDNTQLKS